MGAAVGVWSAKSPSGGDVWAQDLGGRSLDGAQLELREGRSVEEGGVAGSV